jgi:NAD(P)-dependent dehydrogenase (short-subunit alcohol dehydrogenase family)
MEDKNYDMKGKVIIITGSNSGIGKRAAVGLAKTGATVVMACRSKERGSRALAEVKSESDSDLVELILIDLSSQRSIREFVNKFQEKHDRLDVLINNAANFKLFVKGPITTEDGIEEVFATNHVGPFLLTNLLLDLLKSSAPSRIINVSTKGLILYPRMTIEFDDINALKRKKYTVRHAYYHSKMAHLMFTYELAKRLEETGVTVNSVRVANVKIDKERLKDLPKYLRMVYSMKRRFGITPEKMAETYIYLACDPEVEDITGKLFSEKNKPVKSSKRKYDEEVWQRLWELSEEMTGLSR